MVEDTDEVNFKMGFNRKKNRQASIRWETLIIDAMSGKGLQEEIKTTEICAIWKKAKFWRERQEDYEEEINFGMASAMY